VATTAKLVRVTTAPTTPICVVTDVRRPGSSGHDEQDVTITDPAGVSTVSNVLIANGQVFTGGPSGTRIDNSRARRSPGSPRASC
jgi:hypothetical protein